MPAAAPRTRHRDGELVRRWASAPSRIEARRRLMRDYIAAVPDQALQKDA